MSSAVKVKFDSLDAELAPVVVVLIGTDLSLPASSSRLGAAFPDLFRQAVKLEKFSGKKAGKTLSFLLNCDVPASKVVIMSVGDRASQIDWFDVGKKLGAVILKSEGVSVLSDLSSEEIKDVALGFAVGAYSFDLYKTITPAEKVDTKKNDVCQTTFHLEAFSELKKAYKERSGLVRALAFVRDLVNEPANVLTTTTFAKRVKKLSELGLTIEILDEKDLSQKEMHAMLGVGKGSKSDTLLVTMAWNGAAEKTAPLVFVGKGVVFDSGGISIKPAAGMETMKEDMAGAATVVGLMYALASRRAEVNAVGVIGLVENMPDGAAQRPGDVVTSASGKTIEIVNTDAEGRLVLADLLWYAQQTYSPRLIIDLATLTGAVLVALGQHSAGLFANDDSLATQLTKSGSAVREDVWRLPLSPAYDHQIDSHIADMKNVGGRNGAAITAAQFLQRFIHATPWAHLDIAGVASRGADPKKTIGTATGWGVRLLDHFVSVNYEPSK